MRVKDKLRMIRPLRQELELLRQQERIMLLPSAIAYDGTKVKNTPKDKMFETAQATLSLNRLIQKKERELAFAQLEAMTMIYSLNQTEYRRLLILYYMDGNREKRWNEVAHAMGYSESRVKHMHGWALMEIEQKIKDSTQKHF